MPKLTKKRRTTTADSSSSTLSSAIPPPLKDDVRKPYYRLNEGYAPGKPGQPYIYKMQLPANMFVSSLRELGHKPSLLPPTVVMMAFTHGSVRVTTPPDIEVQPKALRTFQVPQGIHIDRFLGTTFGVCNFTIDYLGASLAYDIATTVSQQLFAVNHMLTQSEEERLTRSLVNAVRKDVIIEEQGYWRKLDVAEFDEAKEALEVILGRPFANMQDFVIFIRKHYLNKDKVSLNKTKIHTDHVDFLEAFWAKHGDKSDSSYEEYEERRLYVDSFGQFHMYDAFEQGAVMLDKYYAADEHDDPFEHKIVIMVSNGFDHSCVELYHSPEWLQYRKKKWHLLHEPKPALEEYNNKSFFSEIVEFLQSVGVINTILVDMTCSEFKYGSAENGYTSGDSLPADLQRSLYSMAERAERSKFHHPGIFGGKRKYKHKKKGKHSVKCKSKRIQTKNRTRRRGS